MLGKSPSYCAHRGCREVLGKAAGRDHHRSRRWRWRRVAGSAWSPEATRGARARGVARAGFGWRWLRGGGGEEAPTWANSSLNIQTFCSAPTPGPGHAGRALVGPDAHLGVVATSRMLAAVVAAVHEGAVDVAGRARRTLPPTRCSHRPTGSERRTPASSRRRAGRSRGSDGRSSCAGSCRRSGRRPGCRCSCRARPRRCSGACR